MTPKVYDANQGPLTVALCNWPQEVAQLNSSLPVEAEVYLSQPMYESARQLVKPFKADRLGVSSKLGAPWVTDEDCPPDRICAMSRLREPGESWEHFEATACLAAVVNISLEGAGE